MIVNVDDKVCEANGITKDEAFILAAIQYGTEDMYNHLIKEGYITKINSSCYELNKKYTITNRGINLFSDIVLNSDRNIAESSNSISELASRLREIYPTGKMPGTTYYYKGNLQDIEKKLKSFKKRYGNYTDEDIIKATENYIKSFNGNYTYLKLLKYFIWKDEKRDGETIATSVLADWIENEGQEDCLSNDWTSTLK